MPFNPDDSTWKAPAPPTQKELDEWRRDPRNHISPGTQEITPTQPYNDIGRKPPSTPHTPPRRPTTGIVYH